MTDDQQLPDGQAIADGRRIDLTDLGKSLTRQTGTVDDHGERRWVDVDQARYLTWREGWVLIGTDANGTPDPPATPCLIWRPQPASSSGRPPAEGDVGRWATASISTLAAYVAAHFPDANTGANTTAQVVVGLLDELRQRRAENSQVHRLRRAAASLRAGPGHPGVAAAVADWLEDHAHDLDMAGTPSRTDSPGDLEHATKVADQVLSTEP
jgi:hypothetical protein